MGRAHQLQLNGVLQQKRWRWWWRQRQHYNGGDDDHVSIMTDFIKLCQLIQHNYFTCCSSSANLLINMISFYTRVSHRIDARLHHEQSMKIDNAEENNIQMLWLDAWKIYEWIWCEFLDTTVNFLRVFTYFYTRAKRSHMK